MSTDQAVEGARGARPTCVPAPRTGRTWRLPVALLVAATFGCLPQTPDPEDTLKAFLADLSAGRDTVAYNALSQATRTELERRHELLARAAGRAPSRKAGEILYRELGLMVLHSPPESIVMVSQPGAEVVLRVGVKDGKSADIRMVREGDAWKVDLMRSLKPAPPLEAALRGPAPGETDPSAVPPGDGSGAARRSRGDREWTETSTTP